MKPLEVFAFGMFCLGVIFAFFNSHSNQSATENVAPNSPASCVAIIDHHRGDTDYERAVDRVLSRLARKYDSTPELIGGKATVVQASLARRGIKEDLREILEGVDSAEPERAILGVDEVFAAYSTLH